VSAQETDGPSGGFPLRDKLHRLSAEIIVPRFEAAGFRVEKHGIEFSDKLKDLLRAQDDRCSLMIRFRPDFACVAPKYRSVLCEIKGTQRRDGGLFIEARALKGMMEWNVGGTVALLAVTKFDPGKRLEDIRLDDALWTKAIWADRITVPGTVFVPRRFDFAKQLCSMPILFPDVECVPKPPPGRNASGTPYFVLDGIGLVELGDFIDRELTPRSTSEQPHTVNTIHPSTNVTDLYDCYEKTLPSKWSVRQAATSTHQRPPA
jgi:hypothetical protein